MGCRKSCFEYIFLIHNLNVAVDFLSLICVMKNKPKWRGSGHFFKIIGQTSKNSSNFRH
jgi:hypothetical protein